MGWAAGYISKLANNETVSFRPHGNSMHGKIVSGQLVTVIPTKIEDLVVGDIVLCKVNGSEFLHLVKAIQAGRVQIGNNKGHINGWTRTVFGKCIRIE